jgi:hypothetical protein
LLARRLGADATQVRERVRAVARVATAQVRERVRAVAHLREHGESGNVSERVRACGQARRNRVRGNVVQKRGTRPPQAQERRYTNDVFAFYHLHNF